MKHIRATWVAAFLLVSGGAAHAELLVTESTVDGIAMNATFADGAAFDVPDGRLLRFLKRPQNTTHEIEGPYQGTLADYTPKCSWWARLSGKCGPTSDVEGGTRNATSAPGGAASAPKPR